MPWLFRLLLLLIWPGAGKGPAEVQALFLENLALRQQLVVLTRAGRRPRLAGGDRAFWVLLSRRWPAWREVCQLVKPATVPVAPGRISAVLGLEIPQAGRPAKDPLGLPGANPQDGRREPTLGGAQDSRGASEAWSGGLRTYCVQVDAPPPP